MHGVDRAAACRRGDDGEQGGRDNAEADFLALHIAAGHAERVEDGIAGGFLLFAILAVFVAGLMVGRTPEYVGKKIEAKEVKLAVLAIAILPLCILGFTAISAVLPAGLAGPLNKGPHGFSEILYAYSSATGNNGSAFAGLTAGTPFYNGLLGIAMWLGRFFVIVPMLAIAGSLAAKKYTPESAGSFPTTGPLWVGLLVGIILILGGLTFLPSLALGPIADHLAMIRGQLF